MGSGRTRAGNSDELSDTGGSRAYILGPCRALICTPDENAAAFITHRHCTQFKTAVQNSSYKS